MDDISSASGAGPDIRAPAVSALLPVHNGERYIESALRSVMDQTLREIEIVAVDDGSTDSTPEILARLAAEDPRIRILRQEPNVGLATALNRGLEVCRGEYVARMDGDDLCEPTRFELQKRYLDTHPQVVLIGASIIQIDETDRPIHATRRPRDGFACRWLQRWELPLVHPTFMFRRAPAAAAGLRYDPSRRLTEDHEICSHFLRIGEVVNLPEVLLRYRVHAGSVSRRRWRDQVAEAGEVCAPYHRETMSQEVFALLSPFRDAYFRFQRLDAAGMQASFEGFRRMIAEDLARAPDRRAWMMRQGAQRLLKGLQRGGAGKGAIVRAFLLYGRDFALALGLRLLELKGLLPGVLRTDPRVW